MDYRNFRRQGDIQGSGNTQALLSMSKNVLSSPRMPAPKRTNSMSPSGRESPLQSGEFPLEEFLSPGAARQSHCTDGGDGGLISASIAIDTAVIIASSAGTVYALNANNGGALWSGSAGAPISGPDEQNLTQPLTGLGAAEGYLVVACWHCAQRQARDSVSATGCSPVAAALRGRFE
jgi:outer membrane protein assembly factor BamB